LCGCALSLRYRPAKSFATQNHLSPRDVCLGAHAARLALRSVHRVASPGPRAAALHSIVPEPSPPHEAPAPHLRLDLVLVHTFAPAPYLRFCLRGVGDPASVVIDGHLLRCSCGEDQGGRIRCRGGRAGRDAAGVLRRGMRCRASAVLCLFRFVVSTRRHFTAQKMCKLISPIFFFEFVHWSHFPFNGSVLVQSHVIMNKEMWRGICTSIRNFFFWEHINVFSTFLFVSSYVGNHPSGLLPIILIFDLQKEAPCSTNYSNNYMKIK
jgi:hypothetical protein